MSGSDDFEAKPGQDDSEVSQAIRTSYARLDAVDMTEPPDLIDQAILNRARAAVDKPHSSRPWSFGWLHALTTTAVIVLGLTLLLQMREQAPFPATAPKSIPVPEQAPPMPTATQATPAASPPQAADEPAETIQLRRSRAADVQVISATPEARNEASGISAVQDEAARQAPALKQRSTEDQDDALQSMRMETPQSDPAEWLAEIRRLQEAGLVQEAAGELARLREQWPDMAIPEDLNPLLNPDDGPQ